MTAGKKLLLLGLLLYLLFWRYQVSAIRFLDADEFSYMHWTAQVARGQIMYRDFFSYFTPLFMWVFAPIFWMYGVSAQVFAAGRVFSFVIFLVMLGGLGVLWGMTRGWKWALLPAVILAFLPMPYDKFLEIRPDNLAVLLAILGVIGEIRGLQTKKNIWWAVSGLFYALSLMTLAKTVPIVVAGVGIAILSAFYSKSFRSFTLLMAGLVGPWILFFGVAAISGQLSVTWYSLTKLAVEIYANIKNYPMEPNLFFYPNASFYGGTGHAITTALIVNHAVWILGILVGVYRLVSPFRRAGREWLSELLVSGTFIASILVFSKFFPLKHSQYLIPIAIFIAYYAADGLALFFDWLEKAGGTASLLIILLGFGYILVVVTQEIHTPKLAVTSTTQLTELTKLISTVPQGSRVVDLEGRMVFWTEGYPVCCLAFDTFLSSVSRPPAPLAQYLATNPADYIWDGDSGRMATLTAENMAYIRDNFAPVDGWGGRLWKRK